MAYTINLTNGAIFATVADGTRDTSSSLVIIGKNYEGYGEFIGENFVHVLESHANTSPPDAPLTGQLWFDTSESKLKVYDSAIFKTLGVNISSATEPLNKVDGDMWYDTTTSQIKVYNGTTLVYDIVGPIYSSQTGVTGPVVESLFDTSNAEHSVTFGYADGQIVSISHRDAPFTINAGTPIAGFAGLIYPGIHLASTISGQVPQFTGTATNSELLDGIDSTGFLSSINNDVTSGTLGILNDGGITVGADSDFRLRVDNNDDVIITNNTTDSKIFVQAKPQGVTTNVISVISTGADVRARVSDPLANSDIANKTYVDTADAAIIAQGVIDNASKLSLDGTLPMAGNINLNSNKIVNSGLATSANDVLSQAAGDSRYVTKDISSTINNSGSVVTRFVTESSALGTLNGPSVLEVFQAVIHRDAFMTYHVANDFALQFGLDGITNDLFVGGWSLGPVKHKVHHDGNHGIGTGVVYTSINGTSTVPRGVNRAEITLVGGGGGGSSGGNSSFNGVAGGNGAYSRVLIGSWFYAYGGIGGRVPGSIQDYKPVITGFGVTHLGAQGDAGNPGRGGDGGCSELGFGGKGVISGPNAGIGHGGGGGGGGWGQNNVSGQGGSSGMQWTRIFSVSQGQVLTYQLGSGGAPGVWASRNGGRGGSGTIIIRYFKS